MIQISPSNNWNNQENTNAKMINFPNTKVYFTERQLEVIDCLMLGMLNKQIADKLFISTNTVKFHLKNIFQICGAKSKLEVITFLVKYRM